MGVAGVSSSGGPVAIIRGVGELCLGVALRLRDAAEHDDGALQGHARELDAVYWPGAAFAANAGSVMVNAACIADQVSNAYTNTAVFSTAHSCSVPASATLMLYQKQLPSPTTATGATWSSVLGRYVRAISSLRCVLGVDVHVRVAAYFDHAPTPSTRSIDAASLCHAAIVAMSIFATSFGIVRRCASYLALSRTPSGVPSKR
jgi:hypothetical protein